MENPSLLQHVAHNVRRLRKDRGLSLAEVSSRMGALGVPLSLNGLSKVELGNRDLRLDELIALGAALDVAPVLLIFPLGRRHEIQLLPGTVAATWASLKWFTGQDRFPVRSTQAEWLDIDQAMPEEATTLFREEDQLLARLSHATVKFAKARNRMGALGGRSKASKEDKDQVDDLEDTLRMAEQQLRYHRRRILKAGFEPRELHPDLAYIDEQEN